MTGGAIRAFHRHAQTVVGSELRRARRDLAALGAEERAVVAEVSVLVTAAVVEGVLDQARRDDRVAASLVSIYGPRGLDFRRGP